PATAGGVAPAMSTATQRCAPAPPRSRCRRRFRYASSVDTFSPRLSQNIRRLSPLAANSRANCSVSPGVCRRAALVSSLPIPPLKHHPRRSERWVGLTDTLQLRLEDLEAAAAPTPIPAPVEAPAAETTTQKPARRPLPESLPRTTQTHAPRHTACPDCGGKLRALGEDVAEVLEYVPGHFEVIRLVRPKLSACERIVQEPAPSRPIDRGLAGPGLLAH